METSWQSIHGIAATMNVVGLVALVLASFRIMAKHITAICVQVRPEKDSGVIDLVDCLEQHHLLSIVVRINDSFYFSNNGIARDQLIVQGKLFWRSLKHRKRSGFTYIFCRRSNFILTTVQTSKITERRKVVILVCDQSFFGAVSVFKRLFHDTLIRINCYTLHVVTVLHTPFSFVWTFHALLKEELEVGRNAIEMFGAWFIPGLALALFSFFPFHHKAYSIIYPQVAAHNGCSFQGFPDHISILPSDHAFDINGVIFRTGFVFLSVVEHAIQWCRNKHIRARTIIKSRRNKRFV